MLRRKFSNPKRGFYEFYAVQRNPGNFGAAGRDRVSRLASLTAVRPTRRRGGVRAPNSEGPVGGHPANELLPAVTNISA